MSSAIGFGALNLDKIYKVEKIPDADEESFIKDFQIFPGGSAANTIVGLARLGIKSGYIGKIGDDEEGKILLSNLEREGISTKCVVRSKGRSGYAIILVDEAGRRSILVDPGVNDTIRYEEIDIDEARKYKLIHLTSFICKNGLDSFESQKKIVSEFDIVSFDPGMPYVERGLKDLMPLIKNTTILLPNKMEIERLFGLNYKDAAEECLSLGVEIVAVKLGEEGCWIKSSSKEIYIPALKVKILDTTGAGDAFNAGFLYGFLNGKSLEECGKLGNYVASLCIQHYGARSGLPRSLDV